MNKKNSRRIGMRRNTGRPIYLMFRMVESGRKIRRRPINWRRQLIHKEHQKTA